MIDNLEKNNPKLTESQIFEEIKESLNLIQENLAEKKITVDETKSELKKINEWIQGTKLESKDKKEIWKALDKLVRLEKNIDEKTLKSEVIKVKNLIETLTKKDLTRLKKDIQTRHQQDIKNQRTNKRPVEVQQGIEKSSNNLTSTIHNASQDKNPVAKKIGEWMKKLMS